HATSDGSLLRGEVLARWQDVVGTSEWFRTLEQGVSRLRDRVVGFVRGRRAAEPALVEAVAHGLSAVIQDAAEEAAETAHSVWRHDPAGIALLDGLALSRASGDLRTRTAEQVRAWQGDVLALVETEGAGRRTAARAASYGVNGLGAVLMVAVFASTGGLTGAEIGIVGGSALLAQRVLEAVFGDDAVRRLTQEAETRLAVRTGALLEEESTRFTRQLDAMGAAGRDGDDLRAAADRVRTAMAARPTPTAWGAGELPAGGHGNLRGTGAVQRSTARVHGPESAPRARWWSRWFGGQG
ncbi:ABC transporter, partial [Cellulomonas sp. ICMP 17802]